MIRTGCRRVAPIIIAVVRFEVPEDGIYSIETRYISPQPVRWAMDSCLRVVTCPITASQIGRRRSLALELDAGEHVLEVTLPPGAKLDRVDVQRRDGSSEEYVRIVEDEGFKLGNSEDIVRRRDALRAARRLRDRFDKLTQLRCNDELIAMEAEAIALALAASSSKDESIVASGPNASPFTPQVQGGPPIIPPVDPNAGQPSRAFTVIQSSPPEATANLAEALPKRRLLYGHLSIIPPRARIVGAGGHSV